MLDLQEINNTIEQLENGDTNFANCQKLASLYIVRDNLQKAKIQPESGQIDGVEKELSDILPQYRLYVTVKRKYQLHELPKEAVMLAMTDVCQEIQEFIQTLYTGTDMAYEREQLTEMIKDLQTIYN